MIWLPATYPSGSFELESRVGIASGPNGLQVLRWSAPFILEEARQSWAPATNTTIAVRCTAVSRWRNA